MRRRDAGAESNTVAFARLLLEHQGASVRGDCTRETVAVGDEEALGTAAAIGGDPPEVVVAGVDQTTTIGRPDGAIADPVGRETRPGALRDIEDPDVPRPRLVRDPEGQPASIR